MELTITKALEAMMEIRAEISYLIGCIKKDAPESILMLLQKEIDTRQTLLDEFTETKVQVSESTAKYAVAKEPPKITK